MKQLTLIGRTTSADFPSEGISGVPVKVDTGADSSAIWASELLVTDDHVLTFVLFAKGSKYYSGKRHRTKKYSATVVRSSNGQAQVRYVVRLPITIGGRKVRGSFTLADRSVNSYPVLIGCKLLNKKFLVDVSKGMGAKPKSSSKIKRELSINPKAFFEKYHRKNHRGDI